MRKFCNELVMSKISAFFLTRLNKIKIDINTYSSQAAICIQNMLLSGRHGLYQMFHQQLVVPVVAKELNSQQ